MRLALESSHWLSQAIGTATLRNLGRPDLTEALICYNKVLPFCPVCITHIPKVGSHTQGK